MVSTATGEWRFLDIHKQTSLSKVKDVDNALIFIECLVILYYLSAINSDGTTKIMNLFV